MNVSCFGDSNTFGYDPRSYFGGRYDANNRWVDILAEKTGWDIHNNGMNGREVPVREVIFPKSLDLLIIMLGTNDLLQGLDAAAVCCRMELFLKALQMDSRKLLLIAPVPLQFGEWVSDPEMLDKSRQLSDGYRQLAHKMGIRFMDAAEWKIPLCYDGVHFTEEGHRIFAENLQKALEGAQI